ncbi:hypothetical protein [Streptomyces sp. NPDC057052]|uniref:hypothetical protein n=1 Tax=Streptomyces sp. NPDC057052 TaxID=3346010 RepID=UPI0036317DE2
MNADVPAGRKARQPRLSWREGTRTIVAHGIAASGCVMPRAPGSTGHGHVTGGFEQSFAQGSNAPASVTCRQWWRGLSGAARKVIGLSCPAAERIA